MNEPQIQFDRVTEEQASLYVLGLLTGSDLAAFEVRLAQEAALRDLVRELQRGLEQEVFAEPAPVPPLSVWGRISAQTRSDDAPVVPFPSPWQRWSVRLLAAAACMALGAGVHWWWQPAPATRLANSPGVGSQVEIVGPAARREGTGVQPAPGNALVRVPDVAKAAPVTTSSNAVSPLAGGDTEKLQLERRVRQLTTQVASLNQILQQRMALPSGVTRLHVFQLGQGGQSNPPTLASAGAGRSLAESLARLAAEQLAANRRAEVATTEEAAVATATTEPPPDVSVVTVVPATPVGEAGHTGGTDSEPTVASANVPDLTSLGAPTVFVDPDTGTGSLALPTSSQGQFQFWKRNEDGTLQSLGVVPETEAPVSVVTFEVGDTSADNFFISLEPKGGSPLPTGRFIGGPTSTNALPFHP